MVELTDLERKKLGGRASAYVEEHGFSFGRGVLLVADRYETPRGVRRTLTRVYGPPSTRSRGEVAYWDVR